MKNNISVLIYMFLITVLKVIFWMTHSSNDSLNSTKMYLLWHNMAYMYAACLLACFLSLFSWHIRLLYHRNFFITTSKQKLFLLCVFPDIQCVCKIINIMSLTLVNLIILGVLIDCNVNYYTFTSITASIVIILT